MKTILILFISITLTSNIFSQIEKGIILFSVFGNYNKSNSEEGTTRNYYYAEGNYLNVGVSLGYFASDHIIIGAGLGYQLQNEDRFSKTIINDYYTLEEMEIKANALLPNIYIGYYFKIINNLYFSTNLKFSYGKIKSSYNTLAYDLEISTITDEDQTWDYSRSYPVASTSQNNSTADYCSIQVLPEISYFFTPRLSAYMGLGGIEFSCLDWVFEETECLINFNPVYWNLGMKFRLK